MTILYGRIKERRIIISCFFFVVFASAIGYYMFGLVQFKDRYEIYEAIAETHVNAAFLPGVADNPIRQELNLVLSDVLAREMSDEERLGRAQYGLNVLREAEKQIDDIGEKGDQVLVALESLEVGAFGTSRKSLTALARQRFNIVADIRGLSYRAFYHTSEIFNQIILDEGALTASHVQGLNDRIPLVEEQFDRRAQLYGQLQQINGEIDQASGNLGVF